MSPGDVLAVSLSGFILAAGGFLAGVGSALSGVAAMRRKRNGGG